MSIFITLYRKLRDFFIHGCRDCKPNDCSAESLAHMLQSLWGEGIEQLSELFMVFLPEIARGFFPVLVMLVQYCCLKPIVCSYQIKIINGFFLLECFGLFYKSDSYSLWMQLYVHVHMHRASALTCQKDYQILLVLIIHFYTHVK